MELILFTALLKPKAEQNLWIQSIFVFYFEFLIERALFKIGEMQWNEAEKMLSCY